MLTDTVHVHCTMYMYGLTDFYVPTPSALSTCLQVTPCRCHRRLLSMTDVRQCFVFSGDPNMLLFEEDDNEYIQRRPPGLQSCDDSCSVARTWLGWMVSFLHFTANFFRINSFAPLASTVYEGFYLFQRETKDLELRNAVSKADATRQLCWRVEQFEQRRHQHEAIH